MNGELCCYQTLIYTIGELIAFLLKREIWDWFHAEYAEDAENTENVLYC